MVILKQDGKVLFGLGELVISFGDIGDMATLLHLP